MPTDARYFQDPDREPLSLKEQDIEEEFIEKLRALKYTAALVRRLFFHEEVDKAIVTAN